MANVLLLEPNQVLADTYALALRRGGHVVMAVASAQQAIQAADQLLPDIVVLELQLADHDGIEFLQEFRSYPEWQSLPAIVVTNLPPQALGAVRNVLRTDLSVSVCLYKPRVSLQKLLKLVAAEAQA